MQYLVSVIDDRTGFGHARRDGRHRRVQRPAPGRGALGLRRRARRRPRPRPSSTTGAARPMFTDGPFLESKEYLAGFWIIEAPDLDVALKLAADGVEGLQPEGRGATVPVSRGRRRGGDHPGPPRGVGPGGRHPDAALRRPRHRRGSRRRGVRGRRRAVAVRRRTPEPRRLADHHRQPQGHRPDPAREQARRQAEGGSDAVRRRPA